MKNYIRATIGTIVILTVATAMSLSCLAFDNASNTQSMDALQSRANGYYEKVVGTTTEAESSTYNAVKVYIDRIDILRQATDRDTSEEMALEGKRGESIGILSWIYFSHKSECEADFGADWQDIEAEYEKQRDVIDSAQKDFFEGNGVTVCYTRLLVDIYTRKIEALRVRDIGNGLVNAIIDEALRHVPSRCAYSESFGEDAENCRIYYDETMARVKLQGLRDSTAEELGAVVAKIYSDADFDTSNTGPYSEFFTALNDSSLEEAYLDGDIGERDVQKLFNEHLCDAVVKILTSQGQGGRYRIEYHISLAEAVERAVDISNSESVVTLSRVSLLFEDYARGLAVAEAKDELLLYAQNIGRDSVLDIVLLEYMGSSESGGLFDNAQDIDRVAYELLAAKMRCVWYDSYRTAQSSIAQYLGEGSDKSREARVLYYAVDGRIKAGERHSGENVYLNLAADMAELTGVTDRAEAERYTLDHREIIEKSQVNADDKAALSEAVAASAGLGAGARSYLTTIFTDIAEKYKSVAVIDIGSTIKNDVAKDKRQEAASALISRVAGLSFGADEGLSLTDLAAAVDLYVVKAENIGLIFDSYCYDYLAQGSEYFGVRAEELVDGTVNEIICLTDRTEASMRQSCVLSLKRLASLEMIYASAKGYDSVGEIPTILESAKAEIERCSTEADIDVYASEKISCIAQVIRLYEFERASTDIQDRINRIKARIESYVYISDETRGEQLARLGSTGDEILSSLASAADGRQVLDALEKGLESLASLEEIAESQELYACYSKAKDDLCSAFGKAEYYSVENFALIGSIIEEFTAKLDAADSIEQYEKLRQEGIDRIGQIEDLLRTAKREARQAVEALYRELTDREECYSKEGLASLTDIYRHTLAELDGFTSISEDTPKVTVFAEERMALMRGVRLSVIYTADNLLSGEQDKSYPADYNISESGYVGAVLSADGIPSDIELLIKAVGVDNISELIVNAAKKKMVLKGSDRASSDIIRSLRRCTVLLGMEISLGDILPSGEKYLVSILLPRNIDPAEVLGVVFIRDDGAVEFFEVGDAGEVLKFETTHFSRFYVVGKQDVNILPLIICLSIIVFCELCILALLIIRRRRAKELLYGVFPAPFALASGVRPAGGNIAVAVLGGAALCLGASIAYLLYLELRDKSRRVAKKESCRSLVKVGRKSIVVSKSAEVAESSVSPATDAQDEIENESSAENENPREIMASVSAEAAESLMSDVEVKQIQSNAADYEDTEIYHGEKKSEINIDVISQNFEDGDTVTLNSLKEKKLIPQSAGQVKILARGVLDKRLRVVAQDFSGAAMKMILLTGGEAIVTYSASERGGKRKF